LATSGGVASIVRAGVAVVAGDWGLNTSSGGIVGIAQSSCATVAVFADIWAHALSLASTETLATGSAGRRVQIEASGLDQRRQDVLQRVEVGSEESRLDGLSIRVKDIRANFFDLALNDTGADTDTEKNGAFVLGCGDLWD
jgi:hypothetical protein